MKKTKTKKIFVCISLSLSLYIYIYKIFNPVNLELWLIPSGTYKIFKNRIINLNNHGQEPNVNIIHRANNFLRKKVTLR